MIKAIGTFTGSIVLALAMSISTVPARASVNQPKQPVAPAAKHYVSSWKNNLSLLKPSDNWIERGARSQPSDLDMTFAHALLRSSHYDHFQSLFSNIRQSNIQLPVSEFVRSYTSFSFLKHYHLGALKKIVPDADEALLSDASVFYSILGDLDWQPEIWSDEGEITFEWSRTGKHAFVTFDGDGRYGYAMLIDGSFRGGSVDDPAPNVFPDDLRDYLESA